MMQEVSAPRPVELRVNRSVFAGDFTTVAQPRGVVVFAHGNGSGRSSPQSQELAGFLREHAGVATLLVDLLSEPEASLDFGTQSPSFDIELLAQRLVAATDWVLLDDKHGSLPIGYLGASTGAAAALLASTTRTEVTAIVCSSGRPDLATTALPLVAAPTLLVVGGLDQQVTELNRAARARMPGKTELSVIPNAGHDFEERGTLGQVSRIASDWFTRYLRAPLPVRGRTRSDW